MEISSSIRELDFSFGIPCALAVYLAQFGCGFFDFVSFMIILPSVLDTWSNLTGTVYLILEYQAAVVFFKLSQKLFFSHKIW